MTEATTTEKVTPGMILKETLEILEPGWVSGAYFEAGGDNTSALWSEAEASLEEEEEDSGGGTLLNWIYRTFRGEASLKERLRSGEIRACTLGGIYAARVVLNGTLPDLEAGRSGAWNYITADPATREAVGRLGQALHEVTLGIYGPKNAFEDAMKPDESEHSWYSNVEQHIIDFNDNNLLSRAYRHNTIVASLRKAIEGCPA